MKSSLVLLALLTGCVTVPCRDDGDFPWTHERPTVPFHVTTGQGMNNAWFADGAPTVLTVHNPTDQTRDVHVKCWPTISPSYIDYGLHDGWVVLVAHTETRRLTEFMNVDAINQICHVEDAPALKSWDPKLVGVWRGATGKVER